MKNKIKTNKKLLPVVLLYSNILFDLDGLIRYKNKSRRIVKL
jgi:hypothetical protein